MWRQEKYRAPWRNGDQVQEKVHAGFKNVPTNNICVRSRSLREGEMITVI